VALVDKPAVDIEFLVLKRHTPPSEEDQMASRRGKADDGTDGHPDAPETDAGGSGAEASSLPPEIVRAVKAISAMLTEVLPDEAPEGCEVCTAARGLQAAVDKATPEVTPTEKDEPTDFAAAWEGMVLADTLWKGFMVLETVVTNIARSEKTPEEMVAMFDKALNDFAVVARQILGVAKSEAPAQAEGAADATPDGDGKTTPDLAVDAAEQAKSAAVAAADPAQAGDGQAGDAEGQATGEQAVLELLNELVGWVKDLDARVSKSESGETPEAPAKDGAADAAANADKPVTFAQTLKMVRDEIAKLRNPVYKSKLPQEGEDGQEPAPQEEKPFNVFDRDQRRKRLAELNIGLLRQRGVVD
jgi:hypothetical protein